MSTPPMNPDEQNAYHEALRRIEAWRVAKKHESVLNLNSLKLTALPPEIGQLTALTGLGLSDNQLTALPPEIGKLTALTGLGLSDNQLTALPPEIGKLTALAKLYLSGNRLTALPPQIGQLTALTTLNLYNNQLAALPPQIGQLTALTELRLYNNRLTALPPQIGQLTALTELILSINQLRALPPEIGKLTALIVLDLLDNQLTALPPEIGRLKALTVLSLDDNRLTALPPEIGKLTALTVLSLDNNRLTALPPEIGKLTELTVLYLHHNQLAALPPEMGRLKALTDLSLHDNISLGLPREVLGPRRQASKHENQPAKPQDILAFYFRIHPPVQKDRGRALQEARIILIGDGAAGKTSLVRQLLRGESARSEEASTRDVVIAHWPVSLKKGKVQVNVWDFGGQKQMHAAHPYFFTTRTLYLVVAEARKDQQDRIDYWLKMVGKYGGAARALVVINKVEPKGHAMALDRPKLLGRYEKNLPGDASSAFFSTSCKTGVGISELRASIRHELDGMGQVWALWPQEWFKVKQSIQHMREPKTSCPRWLSKLMRALPAFHQAKPTGAETLQYNEWRRICDECGVPDEKDRDALLGMLGHLGLIIAFPEDKTLRNLGVLNPDWVTRGIYPLLVDAGLAAKGGLLTMEDLGAILPTDRFPAEYHHWLIELMTAFELVFKDSQGNLLLPAQLPVDSPTWAQPAEWADADTLHLELRYDAVLPESVISQFIVRRHGDARHSGEWWRHGIALARGKCEALVRAHTAEQEAKIELRLRGPRVQRHELLSLIRETLRDPRDATPPELHVILGDDCAPKYKDLLIHAMKGLRTMPFIINGESVVRELAPILDMIETPAEQAASQQALTVNIHNENKPENKPNMSQDDHSIHIGGNVTNAQVGQTLTNCTIAIQEQAPGERKNLLEQLDQEVNALVAKLPADKQEEAAGNLELMVKAAANAKPNRPWYDVSAKGLLEAARFVKDFSGDIGGAIKNLGKSIWPDFALPGVGEMKSAD